MDIQNQTGIQTIDLILTKLIYASPTKSEFAIFATNQGFSAKTDFLGDKPESLIGSKISITGEFQRYKNKQGQFENQFVFTDYEIKEEPLFFFLRKMIRGISEKTAREIVATHGDNFGNIVSTNPEALLKIRGVGLASLELIKEDWPEYKKYLQLSKELLPFGITPNIVMKIQKHFFNAKTDQIMQILKTNPYRLIEIDGIGFKKADEIALKLGLSPESNVRVEACIMYCFNEKIMKKGHTAATVETLLNATEEELSVSLELKQAALVALGKDGRLSIVGANEEANPFTKGSTFVAPAAIVAQERYIMQASRRFGGIQKNQQRSQVVENIEEFIAQKNAARLAEPDGKPLGEKQCDAIRLANTLPPIMAIIGYAGTGKTTTSKAVLELYETMFGRSNIIACALAGVAANRTALSSGFNSVTLASLLLKVEGGGKLEQRVILLDEAGMVGTHDMYRLLKAIDFENGAKLVILGDTAQLQPVSAGDPLVDILNNNLIPFVKLDEVYRNGGMINQMAAQIRKGKVPDGYKEVYKDFSFSFIEFKDRKNAKKNLSANDYKSVNDENLLAIQRHIVKMVEQRIPSLNEAYAKQNFFDYLYDTQVLSPMKAGQVGVAALNVAVQAALNPIGSVAVELKSPNGAIRIRDKVLHLHNEEMDVLYEVEGELVESAPREGKEKVRNGQLGVVTKISIDYDGAPDGATVYFPNEHYYVNYSKEQISKGLIDLGWCKTGHKSQGSEYQRTIVPIVNSHYNMLNPKLIYTMMTRAKKYLHLVGHESAFITGCKNMQATNRLTCMAILACDEKFKTEPLDELPVEETSTIQAEKPISRATNSYDKNEDTRDYEDADMAYYSYFSDKREQDMPIFA